MPHITNKIMDDVFAKIMKDIENNILYGVNYNPCTSANAEIPKGIFNEEPPNIPRYGDEQMKKTFEDIIHEKTSIIFNDDDIIVLNESEYTIKDEEI